MDEILIEEKKYVSSKQAAKLTGYAKDYVGQLCREGRVPARLVGRSWYVLESAISDHRFGNPVESKDENTKETKEPIPEVSKAWEFPRYEAVHAEILPSINRLHEDLGEEVPLVQEDSEEKATEASQDIQESWKEWFDQFGDTAASSVENPILPIKGASTTSEESLEPGKTEADEAVSVPLRVVSQYFPFEEPLKREEHTTQEGEIPVKIQRKSINRVMVRLIQSVGIFLATIAAILAIISSGYTDRYISIISSSQVSVISGVTAISK